MRFDEVLRTFAEFFEREGVRWALAGGLAMHAWGRSRSTYDIDFVLDGLNQQRVIAFAESLGYETLFVSAGYSNHRHASKDFGRIDLIYVYGETAEKLLSGATMRAAADEVTAPVLRPEHLAMMKGCLPDFERDMPFDEATLEALDRARDLPPLTFQEYLDFVSSLWLPPDRDDPPPFTEPFTL